MTNISTSSKVATFTKEEESLRRNWLLLLLIKLLVFSVQEILVNHELGSATQTYPFFYITGSVVHFFLYYNCSYINPGVFLLRSELFFSSCYLYETVVTILEKMKLEQAVLSTFAELSVAASILVGTLFWWFSLRMHNLNEKIYAQQMEEACAPVWDEIHREFETAQSLEQLGAIFRSWVDRYPAFGPKLNDLMQKQIIRLQAEK